ncbi:MAG TPA: heme-binding protein [Stellaceae bacterium]|nr:heme-binding protein [Stellaceae bacterium]
MSNVTLARASTIVDTAIAKGRELKLHPLTVVVLDAGGHMVAMKREDKSGILRGAIATGKAWGTLGMGFGGREFARRAAGGGGLFLTALMEASGGRVVPAPGGVLIRDGAGDIVGAVGISGDTSDKDEICAVAGIAAAGLKADTGDPAA